MKTLTSTTLVIDALGGNRGVAALLGTTNKAVSNWRRSKFPANTYVALKQEMMAKDIFAPNWLWAMKKVKHKRKRRGVDNAQRVDKAGRRQV